MLRSQDLYDLPGPSTEGGTSHEAFTFTGTGRDYFRIWIVNLALSVATLGIYSAWAKVRRLQYFYRHTRVAGASFDYDGRPGAILKGRLVVVALIAAFFALRVADETYGLAVLAIGLLALPFLLHRSLRFRLHHTRYRGLRFRFDGTVGQAYWVFLGLPLLLIPTLLTLVPFWRHRLRRYLHGGVSYGGMRFTFDAPASGFYRAYLLVGACLIGLVVYTAFLLSLTVSLMGIGGGAVAEVTGVILILLTYLLLISAAWSLQTALVQNLVWRHTSIGRHRFVSTLEVHRLLAIRMTNLLAIIATVGLFRPFAQIRLARYQAGELTLETAGSLDAFTTDAGAGTSAVGEEATDLLDLDLAI